MNYKCESEFNNLVPQNNDGLVCPFCGMGKDVKVI
jgi:hypothetical protein